MTAPVPAPAPASFDGSAPLIGRYQLRRLAFESKRGKLFEGTDLKSGAPVAVKILDGGGLTEDHFKRYHRGTRALATIRNRHVVSLYEAALTPAGSPFIVYEWVPGRPLSAFLAERGAAPVDHAAGVLCQMLEGLGAAHKAGIVHRDVTAAHVLVVPTDDGAVAKLFGFGLAKGFEGDDGNLTRVGKAVGTPRYMSPEQLRAKPVDPRTDLFSAGVIFYEMLAGKPPYVGDDLVTVAKAILFDPVPTLPASLPEATRKAAGPIIARALAKDPKDRYPGALEMRNVLLPVARSLAIGDFGGLLK